MVLGYIAAITSLLFCALGLRMTKKFLNPITVFCGLWFGIFFLSSMELYNLNPSSTHTYMCLFIGVLMFFLGFVANYYFIKTERIVLKNITDTGYKMYAPKMCIRDRSYSDGTYALLHNAQTHPQSAALFPPGSYHLLKYSRTAEAHQYWSFG